MAVNSVVYVNECGLPLNAVEWLETHHESKMVERKQMIQDLHLKQGCLVVDAGCGPGLWTPLLAEAIGVNGKIVGVDISLEALVMAQKRCSNTPYRHQVQYKRATLEQLPLEYGTADVIFTANVSQYLEMPVDTFAAMGRYLAPGGRLIVKDIDFGTLYFSNIDQELQKRVFDARKRWEQVRMQQGFSFEDSWVGPKLAGYLQDAGYWDVQVKRYHVVRHAPLAPSCYIYLQGVAEWFVCEDAPLLDRQDVTSWLQAFLQERGNALQAEDFIYEETEYVVTGVKNISIARSYFDMHRTDLHN
jgi:ubiquinone/menaquinone biosynthesis C-methylase UbiE